ncbi:MAG: ABC transporter ATP-binding protein [Pseudobdellovibrionaceae bacterium]
MTETSPKILIEFKGIKKVFGDCVANENIDFSVKKGSIHGIVGENGAGKSTAMKILYGIYPPSQGEIVLNGKPLHLSSPRQALLLGIGMVHQHFLLSDPETVLDNIILGLETKPFRGLKRTEHEEKLSRLTKDYGLSVSLNSKIYNLSVGEQQRVEIIKLLYRDCEVLILDEPTAVLTPQETEAFLNQLKKLKSAGKTILLISHKLKEVMSVTDQITVFRSGKVVGNLETSKTSIEEIASLMIGRIATSANLFERKQINAKSFLKVSGLNAKIREVSLEDLNFELKSGEILGIAGVDGNGQSQLLESLYSYSFHKNHLRGKIEYLEQNAFADGSVFKDFNHFRKGGVGLLPQNRQLQALLMDSTLSENSSLGHHFLPEFQSWGFQKNQSRDQICAGMLEKFDVRPRLPQAKARQLSGGNQQKFVVARELRLNPKILIVAHPTRGVDIGAIEFIHKQLIEARNRGCGILLVSSELEELMSLSDRILVMYKGRFQAEFSRQSFNENEIGLAMAGSSR